MIEDSPETAWRPRERPPRRRRRDKRPLLLALAGLLLFLFGVAFGRRCTRTRAPAARRRSSGRSAVKVTPLHP